MPEKLDIVRRVAELGIAVESQRQCTGSCAGCVLPKEERGDTSGQFSHDDQSAIRQLGSALKAAYDEAIPAQADDHPLLTVVRYGQGEHFAMPSETLADLVDAADEMMGGTGSAQLTTSLLIPYAALDDKLSAFADAAPGLHHRAFLQAALDPALISRDKSREAYLRGFATVFANGLTIEPTITVPPQASAAVSPEVLDAFLIAVERPYVETTLAPTLQTGAAFARHWHDTIAWLRKLVAIAERHGRYAYNFAETMVDSFDIAEGLGEEETISLLAERLRWSIFIGQDRQIYLGHNESFSGFIPLSHRFGYRPVARLSDGARIVTDGTLATRARAQATKIAAEYASDAHCKTCPYRKACALNGFYVTKRVMRDHPEIASENCPIGVRSLFEDVIAGESKTPVAIKRMVPPGTNAQTDPLPA